MEVPIYTLSDEEVIADLAQFAPEDGLGICNRPAACYLSLLLWRKYPTVQAIYTGFFRVRLIDTGSTPSENSIPLTRMQRDLVQVFDSICVPERWVRKAEFAAYVREYDLPLYQQLFPQQGGEQP